MNKDIHILNNSENNSEKKIDKLARAKAIKEKGFIGRPKVSEEKKDIVVEMYNKGEKLKDIAEELNISISSVCNILKERT